MTRVLFYEPSYRRVEKQIADIPNIEPLLMQKDGRILFGGKEILDARPEIGWVATDLFAGPMREFMVALLKSPSLKWVQSGSAGFDNPVFAQIVDKGARLTTNNAQAVGMAEYTLATVLDYFQRGPERRTEQTAHRWTRMEYREVMGSRWLILGFGAIGQEIARRARAFGAIVTGIRRTQAPHELADTIAPPGKILELLPSSDVVVLVLPLSKQTARIANAAFFAQMKPQSVLVNIGRGQLVDETALVAALDLGRPAHAILDVFETEPLPASSPLWDHPRVSLTAHASAIGTGLALRSDRLFIENLRRFLANQPLINEANPRDVKAS